MEAKPDGRRLTIYALVAVGPGDSEGHGSAQGEADGPALGGVGG